MAQRKYGIAAMPRCSLRVSMGIGYLVFEPHAHKNGKPVFFSRQVLVAFVLVRIICIGHISWTTGKQKGTLSIC